MNTLSFQIPEEDHPLYKAYRKSVWENDALDQEPINVGKNILILPWNSRNHNTDGYTALFLDSRYAFGDGRHPTTVLCLTLLEDYLLKLTNSERSKISMLDIGTGTGVLSILASKMGVDNITAVDIDPESILNASDLARLNVSASIDFRVMDAQFLPNDKKYGLVTANLLPPILRTVIPLAAKLSHPGAPVIISGIGDTSCGEMEALMKKSGFTEITRITSGWWHAYLIRHE